jgi:CHAT domain-containing protein/tetratricopeptide (TPR) repeat protein
MSFLSRAILLLAAVALPAVPARSAVPLSLAACDAGFAAAPNVEASASCFFDAGLKEPAIASRTTARMEELLAAHPGHPWLSLYLGHAKASEPERAIALYRTAAAAFAAGREARGEVLARGNLQRLLIARGRNDEAKAEAERAEKVAIASRDPELIARAKIILARHLFRVGEGLDRAYILLREARDVAFPRGAYFLKRDSLYWLGNVSVEMGRYAEARRNFALAADLARAQDDAFGEASARYGIARAFLDQMAQSPHSGFKTEAIALARQALTVAETAKNLDVETKAHWLLGMLTDGAEARGHLTQCLATANDYRNRGYCLNALARHLAAEEPQQAREAIREALDLAHQAEDPWSMAYSWRERMRVSWAAADAPKQAVADSYAALDAIEALRDLQAGSSGQAELFSSWLEDYSWLAGRLLQAWLRWGDPNSLAEAFSVTERMHARALLDALTAARAAPVASAETKTLQSGRAALLEDISQVQRRLFDPNLPAAERQKAGAELERLELAEADLRSQLSPAGSALAALRAPAFATLAQVQSALGPDEAFLSFQIAPEDDVFGGFGGGTWLLVSTRTGSRAYRLRRDRVALGPAVALFNGLFPNRDGSEVAPAVGLYNLLLADALRDLPAGVQRLVIVPDDVLHQLPFAALRAAADAPPLAEQYQITQVPSATLWLRWRASPPPAAPTPLLALADPVLPGMGPGMDSGRAVVRGPAERAAIFAGGLRLGALPFARQEGRSAVRHLDGESALRIGGEASEGFLKTTDLRRFGILHFATHAVLDDQNPERSGVLLTPAPATEDGLLQIREIVPLHLDGRIVVLSSCRSASGTVLRGEGVLGIARAFFQAGAHTVVASLWPLRDDDGAALFDRFYAHLGEGMSVGRALHAAQRDRIADGAPAYAWAGLIALGDGDLVPLPGGRPAPRLLPWIAAVAALGLLISMAFLRKKRSTVR